MPSPAPSSATSSKGKSKMTVAVKAVTVKPKPKVSSNWAALKSTIAPSTSASSSSSGIAGKKRKRAGGGEISGVGKYVGELGGRVERKEESFKRGRENNSPPPSTSTAISESSTPETTYSPLIQELRSMVLGTSPAIETKTEPGKYLCIDCEMVGVGALGEQSSLGRVSIVNYHGAVVYDTFVRPKERVVDYRTWVSGVSAADLINAPTFEEVIVKVAQVIKGKVLIGHAIQNDFSAMLLSHPAPFTRDTQKCPELRKIAGSRLPGLKKLTKLVLGLEIQEASHSSVTDARATMALYRTIKDTWEPTFSVAMVRHEQKTKPKSKTAPAESFPGGGRRGVSSGLGSIVSSKTKGVTKKGKGPGVGRVEDDDRDDDGDNWWDE